MHMNRAASAISTSRRSDNGANTLGHDGVVKLKGSFKGRLGQPEPLGVKAV